MKTAFRTGIIFIALATASACGFHLRNSASLPSALAPIYIGGPAGNSALGRKLRYQLTNSNTAVTEYSAKAAYQLILLDEDQDRRIISLDRRGLAAEYGITMSVEFELRDNKGNRVLGPQKIDERRTITNNPDNALTTAQDISLVSTDMEQVIAVQIVRRLGAYATHKLPAAQLPASPTPNDAPDAGKASSTDAPQTAAPQN